MNAFGRSGDSFVLDTGRTLYVWNGAKANINERSKALMIANLIKNNERTGTINLVNVEQEPQHARDFWIVLGGQPSEVASMEEGGDDAEAEKVWPTAVCVHKVLVANGVATIEACGAEGTPPTHELLSTTTILAVDTETEFYMWVGRGVSEDDSRAAEALAKAELLAGKAARPSWVTFEQVAEDKEPMLFKYAHTHPRTRATVDDVMLMLDDHLTRLREKFVDWPSAAVGLAPLKASPLMSGVNARRATGLPEPRMQAQCVSPRRSTVSEPKPASVEDVRPPPLPTMRHLCDDDDDDDDLLHALKRLVLTHTRAHSRPRKRCSTRRSTRRTRSTNFRSSSRPSPRTRSSTSPRSR
jgi:hypothetical protein